MAMSIFNSYDEKGYRLTITNCRSSKIQDEAIVYNLRFRWPNELSEISDAELVNIYDCFAASDDFGNNDEKFLEYMNALRASY